MPHDDALPRRRVELVETLAQRLRLRRIGVCLAAVTHRDDRRGLAAVALAIDPSPPRVAALHVDRRVLRHLHQVTHQRLGLGELLPLLERLDEGLLLRVLGGDGVTQHEQTAPIHRAAVALAQRAKRSLEISRAQAVPDVVVLHRSMVFATVAVSHVGIAAIVRRYDSTTANTADTVGAMRAFRLFGLAVLTALGAWSCGDRARDTECRDAHRALDWKVVTARCGLEPGRAVLGWAQSWLADRKGVKNAAADASCAAVEPLFATDLRIDATYVCGYVHASTREHARKNRGRELLLQALVGFQAAGRHNAAARAAEFLARVPRAEALFEDRLRYGMLTVTEATLSGEKRAIAHANVALAAAYDEIGMDDEARDAFTRAVAHSDPGSEAMGRTLRRQGIFLVDRGGDDLTAGVAFLRSAREQLLIARSLDHPSALAIELNLAVALAMQGKADAAERELTEEPIDDAENGQLALVRGYIAAEQGELVRAEALFASALSHQSALTVLEPADLDYRWQVALELARGYRRAGRDADAERHFRQAIGDIEQLRIIADGPELRPWILQRRNQPYLELLSLLATQGRGLDALVTAESLHARTFLDVVLGRASNVAGEDRSLRAARLRAGPARPALDAPSLLAKLGGREAIVFAADGTTIWRMHVNGGAVTIKQLSTDEVAAIERFRAAPADRVASAEAATALLPPGLTDREGPLYIVPGELAYLPFAALWIRDRFLIETRTLSWLPGLAALGCSVGPWPADAVHIGNAEKDNADRDLPRAEAEVVRIAGDKAHIGSEANLAAFRSAARAEHLHVAVHGVLTDGGGALRLHDGLMTAPMVLDERIAPRTVLLTGCATAYTTDAEAFGGFPSAFLAAGSQHVVATLRSVKDDEAAIFMAAYAAQPASLGPAARLAATQRALVSTHGVEVWSPFTAWGDAACGP